MHVLVIPKGAYVSWDDFTAKAPAEAALAFRRSILAAGGLMAAGALVFLLGANFWISLLLSARFIPARGFIVIYVVGDCLRTLPAALMFTALARRRTGTYAGLELLNAAIFAGVTLGLMAMGFGLAPAFAYIAAGLGVAGAGLATATAPAAPTSSSPAAPVRGWPSRVTRASLPRGRPEKGAGVRERSGACTLGKGHASVPASGS